MENNKKHKILLGLTTTPKSDWREKTREIDELGLKEIALFPTCLEADERRELFGLLEKTGLERLPHVHLRDGMTEAEVDYLVERFHAEVFNTHADRNYEGFLAMKELKGNLYIENCWQTDDKFVRAVSECAGICVDFGHWEDLGIRQNYESYGNFPAMLKKNHIGCCHISAVRSFAHESAEEKKKVYHSHYLYDMSELDYVKAYKEYLPPYVSIELENSFTEQIKVKEYLEKLLAVSF
ncbi:hypothetical protein A2303_04340 [Candidatus Falkowbacteria bacterium RIFOXYB2_FULL_47_14]|uniref:Xylose isomerase-like TIM barrel domain-containing protein n=1 Tax=Candidatus Falkowbacteria bacterium RIFOXYA2_FULL_47_19 TaxID=1797994 RepID=A0A1F5SK93_9BACT|nr:MAG: hypothetical protein A2227_04255 [Candidatus Falkowbacteria bacterium RIFOXYA2_FULL_47_19]OGF36660.1 MAG: hypothetical protein A2468_02835 [Candidatus Falkowbacteria bacterium RIFOXYC2_FULL_46_15]OGF43125.1 MAG: hypothetical protein A2303_04340 [Candidatus Falkowbacteria bacterium RIFOXYB2_FULL_47_14]